MNPIAPFRTPAARPAVRSSRPLHGLRALAALALAGAATLPLHAQATDAGKYPERPVRLIVSYAAGNVTDSLARIVSDKLSAQWGQAVTVENRPGQGGSIGAQTAVKAPADGYTLLFSAMAAMAINPHVYSNLGYDVRKDFLPIINVAYPSSLIVATPALKINNFKALVDYSKANPTALNYGTAGNGTVPHLNMEAIKEMTGLVAQHIPYKAASAVMTDVMGGRLQLQGESVAVVMPQIKAGNLVPIAATSVKRLPQLPDLPTVSELVPGYVPVVPWLGIFAPVGTPPAIIAKVNQDVTAILNMPDVQQRFHTVGLTTSGDGPQEFARTINSDYERLGKLVRQLGLKVD
ncbi:tripartite tricarboxylate transporter substrate binding protein [Comamonadaceae bacterium G21597-S1]|nr:tripartite tricarboxylate transporter substrate binding protein [Comamonadaceae bacterium G21597-S1]